MDIIREKNLIQIFLVTKMNKRPPNDFSGSSYQSRPSESPTCKRAKVVLSPNARRHRSRTPENVSSPCKILQVVKVEAMENDEQQEQIPESSGSNARIKVKEEEIGEENEHEKEKFEVRINSRNEETQTEKAPNVPTVDTPFGSFKLYGKYRKCIGGRLSFYFFIKNHIFTNNHQKWLFYQKEAILWPKMILFCPKNLLPFTPGWSHEIRRSSSRNFFPIRIFSLSI